MGRADLEPEQQWETMVGFYQDFMDSWPVAMKCMQELVTEIQLTEISKTLYPSTSLTSLGISAFNDYGDRRQRHNPMAYVKCDKLAENFHVSFQMGQGNTVKEADFPVLEDNKKMLDEINKWVIQAKS